MKKKMAVLVLGMFLVGSLFGCGPKVPEGTVATVNGEPISQEELDVNYQQMLQMYQFYGYDVTDDTVKMQARNGMLNNMITQELLLQEAAKRGLEVTDEELESSINDLVENQYGGSMADLEAAVEQAGMTMDYFREAQRDDLQLTKLQENLVNEPETVDVIKARHILIGNETENAEQVAADLIAQLDNGADFATLATENSTDAGSAADGGELGYFAVTGLTTSKMVDEFAEAAKALEIGEYSKTPVQSQFGYHIILVEDKQDNVNLLDDPEKYESVLQGIYGYGLQNLAMSLQEDADIEILLDMESVPETPAADNTDGGNTDDGNTNNENADDSDTDAPADDEGEDASQQ